MSDYLKLNKERYDDWRMNKNIGVSPLWTAFEDDVDETAWGFILDGLDDDLDGMLIVDEDGEEVEKLDLDKITGTAVAFDLELGE